MFSSNFTSKSLIQPLIYNFSNKGPITYTSEDGTTTLYGVASRLGADDRLTDIRFECQVNTLIVRVSAPEISKWIKTMISKYE